MYMCKCRPNEREQQAEQAAPEASVYPAPPGGFAREADTGVSSLASKGDKTTGVGLDNATGADKHAGMDSLPGPASPAPSRSSLTGEGSGGYTASPKSWYELVVCVGFVPLGAGLLPFLMCCYHWRRSQWL